MDYEISTALSETEACGFFQPDVVRLYIPRIWKVIARWKDDGIWPESEHEDLFAQEMANSALIETICITAQQDTPRPKSKRCFPQCTCEKITDLMMHEDWVHIREFHKRKAEAGEIER